jgi:hypothetical protein
MLPGRDGDQRLCRRCAGITTDLDCHRCGAEGEHHRRGLCTRCTLRDDITFLLLPGNTPVSPRLARLVDVLASVDRPESVHVWKRHPKVQQLLRALGDGSLTLDRESFDAVPAGPTREHIRQLLVLQGLLPYRDADLARFEAWLGQRLDSIGDPAVRRPLEQFATWHHGRRLRSKASRGRSLHGPVRSAKQEITETGKFLSWLAGHGKTIAECSQADLDQWIAEGPTTHHLIRTFIVWANDAKLTAGLRLGFRTAKTMPLITHERRLDLLARCLADTHDTLAYRVAAALLLLYAQPLVRIARLRTEDVQAGPLEIFLKLGTDRGTPVPEPFAGMLRTHLAARPNMRTANSTGSPWLFPSTRAGGHLDPDTIRKTLRESGIDLLGSRNAALREIVRQMPAPIAATQLGYSHQVTQKHAALAAEPMSQYPSRKSYAP